MRACSSSVAIDLAVENLDDAIDVGNQFSCLQCLPCWGRAPKMTLVFHFDFSNGPLWHRPNGPGVPSLKHWQEPCQQGAGKVAALFLALQGLPKPAVMPLCSFAA
jgi:hypothetical protein